MNNQEFIDKLNFYWKLSGEIPKCQNCRLLMSFKCDFLSKYYMICDNTIDEYMRELLDAKQEMIDRVVDGKLLNFSPSKSIFGDFVRKLKAVHKLESNSIDFNAVMDDDISEMPPEID